MEEIKPKWEMVKQQAGARVTTWWPQFRVIDTARVTPDPDVAAVVARYEQELSRELDAPLGTTAVELDSRNATVRTISAVRVLKMSGGNFAVLYTSLPGVREQFTKLMESRLEELRRTESRS